MMLLSLLTLFQLKNSTFKISRLFIMLKKRVSDYETRNCKVYCKGKESLKASQVLAKNKLYNLAGARAYYTMFDIADAFLWEKGLTLSSHVAETEAVP